jgi:hypothetical protein
VRANVTTTSSRIAEGPLSLLIRNITGTANVYLETGNSTGNATEAEGFEWLSGDPALEIELWNGESLYGIVASGGAEQHLHILPTVRDG